MFGRVFSFTLVAKIVLINPVNIFHGIIRSKFSMQNGNSSWEQGYEGQSPFALEY